MSSLPFIDSLNSAGEVSFNFTWDAGGADLFVQPKEQRVQIDFNGVRRECRITETIELPDGTMAVTLELIEDAPNG